MEVDLTTAVYDDHSMFIKENRSKTDQSSWNIVQQVHILVFKKQRTKCKRMVEDTSRGSERVFRLGKVSDDEPMVSQIVFGKYLSMVVR